MAKSKEKPAKLNLYERHKAEYATPKEPQLVDTQPGNYLVVDGRGKPEGTGGDVFERLIGALYGMAYTVKFASKFAGRDFVVCKLECIWGMHLPVGTDLETLAPEDRPMRLMIRVPEFITDEHLDEARASLAEKGKEGDYEAVHLETIDEGRCVQMLHVGPYEEERTTLEAMRAFVAQEGWVPAGPQHEIYLSDPRRVPPEKLRTILRLPIGEAVSRR